MADTEPRAEWSDVVVIGGGVVGAATAGAVARRGKSVTLIERGSLSKANGSSRGGARIIAPAAFPDNDYLDAGLRAMEGWQSLEAEMGTQLLKLDGALYVGSAIDDFARSLDSARVDFELLSPRDVESRFGILPLDESQVLFQPGAGVIRASAAHAALLRSAAGVGVALRENERVTAIEPCPDGVHVRTRQGTWICDRVVVVAGPWTADLLCRLDIAPPLTVSSQSVAYFPVPSGAANLPALMEFDGDEPYALIDPEFGLKAALHRQGPEAAPDNDWSVVDIEAIDLIAKWIGSRFGGIASRPTKVEACLYTSTPDERFVIERHGAVVVGSACSGQGFQFAPDTGERLARIATGGAD